ncbi:YegS/Rv2252/BmrU family lipid kinase [Nonomuraea sp. KC401]|uniref:diacylglycerol/lipid kinase family protein n=1 Tax=unclassified Nonomuraea TaxID=2593643 RepID=UPI0010FD4472|nr:YegS/Rv2252/BmrU family lipid kinase [Nonomuraea sp. KC401]NBE95465.1 YegS/Rv2252/BmrU family lipid kinase [Nonomuraea sp. K271]TLF83432.1 YegS/Rv2252/BmrU family lipid kinase [Nonomuraea sp. KC401]
MSPQLALLVNPAARGGRTLRLLEPVARRLRAGGAELSVIVGDDAGDALDRACTAVAERPDALVAFGGDGLVHLAVQAVAGTDVPLGIIPAGTGNDIAAALGVPCGDPIAAARTVLRMRPRSVDAARVVAGAADELFAGVMCCGFDSRVNERANRLAWPPGMARYVVAMVDELRSFRPIPFRVTLDEDEVIEREAMLVAVANTRSYGAGMRVSPDASPDDGLLDVVMLEAVSKAEFLRVFPSVYRGTHVGHRAVSVRRVRSVRLEAADVVAYADGERVGPVPAHCEVRPGAFRVLV